MNGIKDLIPPPEYFEWEYDWRIGKTGTSIKFVNDAEKYIKTCANERVIRMLEYIISGIKNGSCKVTKPIKPKDLEDSFGKTWS